MIDIESIVVDTIQDAFTAASKSVLVINKLIATPESFPCVMVQQTSNQTYTKTQDGSLIEHHANVTFQIDVFSNLSTGSKKEVKELFSIVDAAMQGMKFTRRSYGEVPNIDYTISRCVGTYSAIVASPTTSGTTTTYKVYRK